MKVNRPTPLTSLDPAIVVDYSHAVHETYLQAEKVTGGACQRRYMIGGKTVHICALGEELLSELTAALGHLAFASQAPADLTIHVWDSATNETPHPPSPLAWYSRCKPNEEARQIHGARFDARGELPACNTWRIRTAFHVWPSMLMLLDIQQGMAFFWIENVRNLPYYETGAPFSKILSWWMNEQGRLFVHGGAVGNQKGGVILVGPPGAGKSTAVLACLRSNLQYAGDDYCLIAFQPAPHVQSLYNTAKLKSRADLDRFPHLAPMVENIERLEREKALMFLYRHYPGEVITGFPLRALLIPKVTGAVPARLVPVSPAAGLSAMAPSTIKQLPGIGRGAWKQMAQLVKLVPSYLIEVGPDVSTIPTVIEQLLSAY
jgi:hypothetical protein